MCVLRTILCTIFAFFLIAGAVFSHRYDDPKENEILDYYDANAKPLPSDLDEKDDFVHYSPLSQMKNKRQPDIYRKQQYGQAGNFGNYDNVDGDYRRGSGGVFNDYGGNSGGYDRLSPMHGLSSGSGFGKAADGKHVVTKPALSITGSFDALQRIVDAEIKRRQIEKNNEFLTWNGKRSYPYDINKFSGNNGRRSLAETLFLY